MSEIKALLTGIFSTAFLISTPSLSAKAEIIQWQGGNVQLLRGWDYKVDSPQGTIATFEYANSWLYGDAFAFLDRTWPDTGKPTYYAEFSPRFSLGKIFDTDLSYGLIKDVLISTTLEKPLHQGPRYLYGGAIDLNLPGFKFFNTNAYLRDDTQLDGQTWQVTLAWSAPFEAGGAKFETRGYADFAGEEDTAEANQQIVPQLLLDAGNLAGLQDNKLFLGIEWHYWHNKYGIEGITQSAPQAMVLWNF